MVRCPNCGQKTSGEDCQWCKYPILRDSPTGHGKAEKQAKKEAERAAKEQAKREAKEAQKAVQDTGSEIYEGDVQLVVPSPVAYKQWRQFEEHLERVKNLRIVWIGGSVEEGAIIAVSLQKPRTLIRILNKMPMVQKVDENGEKIVVMLNAPTVS